MTREPDTAERAIIGELNTAIDSLGRVRRLVVGRLDAYDAPTRIVALLVVETAFKATVAMREAHALLTGKPLVDPRVRIVPTPAQIEARRMGGLRLVRTTADEFAAANCLNPDGPDGAA